MTNISITDNIIRVDGSSSTYVFDCTRLDSYSQDIKDYDIEYIYADQSDNYLTVVITAASGQAGVIAIVDMDSDSVIHIQNAPFAIAAKLYESKVISLHFVSSWEQSPYYNVEVTDLNFANTESGSRSIRIDSNIEFDSYNGTISMTIENNKLKISDGNTTHIEDISNLL